RGRQICSQALPDGGGGFAPLPNLPPERSASRRTSGGWGPRRPRRAIRRSEPQDVAGLGSPPSEASNPEIRAAGRRGAGVPAVRGEESGDPSRRTARGWAPCVRGEQSGACAGKAGARTAPITYCARFSPTRSWRAGLERSQADSLAEPPRLAAQRAGGPDRGQRVCHEAVDADARQLERDRRIEPIRAAGQEIERAEPDEEGPGAGQPHARFGFRDGEGVLPARLVVLERGAEQLNQERPHAVGR